MLRFSLDGTRFVVGRGEQSDVVIPDPEVSRQQAAFVIEGGTCVLEDLSGKGTEVAGTRQTRAELKDGMDVALGQWRAVYRESSGAGHDAKTHIGEQTKVQPAANPRDFPAQVRIRYQQKEVVKKLTAESFTVGKDPSCDLPIDDSFVSGRHVKIARRDGRFAVSDQRSTNGTWVGNARIYEAEVPLFTTLRVGQHELVLEPQGSGQKREEAYQGIIGSDPSVRTLADLIERVAPSSAAVAIFGESGTGKELVAKAVHDRSTRKDKPFIPVNCAAISKELIESELFGHEKGAFTNAMNARKGAFEEADGGTLFLDEIGELPLDLQAKLLRALESGEIKRVGASRPIMVDVRIVAATNRDLLQAAKTGAFREDLYYRLNVVPLHIPPLRARRRDVPALANHFLSIFGPRNQQVLLTASAMEKLENHSWPGNIRELRNAIHRALLLRRGPNIDGSDITFDDTAVKQSANGPDLLAFTPGQSLETMLGRIERQIVVSALAHFDNNRERVAKELSVSRSTLFKKLKEWGLTNAED